MNRFVAIAAVLLSTFAHAAPYDVGVGTVDITPTEPIRLSGYLSRKEEVSEIEQRLFAKAIAIQSRGGVPVVLITVDNCALNLAIGDEVCARLEQKKALPRARIAINFSHTHSAPALTNAIPNIFGQAIPLEQQDRIARYTQRVIDAMESAALAALDDLKPATLHFGIGSAGFAKNRRTPGGPVDHDLPVLCVKGEDGAVRAVVAGYACHCTVLSANKVSGDWAGYAQEYLQAAFPGATGMVTIGCGADQNPLPRGTVEHAIEYGHAIADGAKAVVEGGLREISGAIDAALVRVPLAFDTLPTREDWEARAKEDSPKGYHARLQMLRMSRGEAIATEIPYTVQRINFGEELAMLFLAGEVVVDYSTRFKIEYDRNRLWVSGYSNDVPCYIPSARILAEGGYEGADAMIYYDQPTKFAPDVEDRIAAAVHGIMPPAFKDSHAKTGGFPPLRPHDALKEFVLPEGYEVQLVANEPQIVDPVAVDFAPDGAIFVAEMHDYNRAPGQNDPPTGRISRLVDTNGDGFYDASTVYLNHVAYPTGVTVWRGGILVCSAPDLIYAEDTNGDGVADERRVLFTGFTKNNFQARLNSLSWGLDNWMYGAGGLLGGRITRADGSGETVALGGRDFRFNPDTLVFETATGNTQYGRARDDWDNWFGCDSSNLLKFHALPEHLLAKAPNVVPPPAVVTLAGAPYDIYPVSSHVERFNDPGDLNRVTSACGLAIYRDDLLGDGFRGNAFNCEPVHNLVTRLVVEPKGALFTARRAEGEENREFFASRDHWFRPAQVRTGPDGALWVVDMYRYVCEHEKWITPDRREALDMLAGENMGRIYRIKRKDTPLRPVEDLTKLDTTALVAALENPNGTVRDLVHQMLLWRADPADVAPMKALVLDAAKDPMVRTQALCVLDGRDGLDSETLLECLVPIYDFQWNLAGVTAARAEWSLTRNAVEAEHPSSFITVRLPQMPNDVDAFRRHLFRLSGTRAATSADLIAQLIFEENISSAATSMALAFTLSDLCSQEQSQPRRLPFQGDEHAVAESVAEILTTWSRDWPLPLTRMDWAEGSIVSGPPDPPTIYEGPDQNALIIPEDDYVIAAALVAASNCVESVIEKLPNLDEKLDGAVVRGLAVLAATEKADNALRVLFKRVTGDIGLTAIFLDVVRKRGYSVESLSDATTLSQLEQLRERATETLTQSDSDATRKITAFHLFAHLQAMDESMLNLFGNVLMTNSPPALQQAVIDTLAARDEPAAAEFLIAHLPDLGPEARNAALDALTRRAAWCGLFLDHLEATPGARLQLDAARKQFLLKHPDVVVRVRAEALLGGANTARAEVLTRYAETETIAGDPARGVPLFEERCGQCHVLDGKGHALGPDLSALTDKSAATLLKAILDPNETVLEQYQAFTVETTDLRTLSGIVSEETANSITLKMAGGTQETLLRSDIDKITNAGLSLMPEGLEENLSPAQMADVLAFVQSRAPVAKVFAGNVPATVARNAEGGYSLTAENAAIFGGPKMEYRPRFGAIGGWETPSDRAEWSLEVAEGGEFTIEMTWTAPPGAEGAPWHITSGASALDGALAATGGMENFVLREIGRIALAPGPQTLTFAPTAPVKYGMMELRAITLKKLDPPDTRDE